MSINKGILIEIERETENTRRLFSVLQDEHLSFKPHEKSMTLGELATHIVDLHNWVKNALTEEVFDFKTMYKPQIAKTVEDLKAMLNDSYAGNVSAIEKMTDEDWQKIWTLKSGEHIIVQLPKIGGFRFIIQNHLIHHRGQLTVYMRMLNLPLPGIYGPSADER